MSWIQQIPDEELIDITDGYLNGMATAIKEIREAKLNFSANNEASQVRYTSAIDYFKHKLEHYNEASGEMLKRGLKNPS